MPVELALENLSELWPEKMRGTRVGALLHPASVSSKLEHASHILERHTGDLFELAAFFGPQHGFLDQTQDNMVGTFTKGVLADQVTVLTTPVLHLLPTWRAAREVVRRCNRICVRYSSVNPSR